jgi:hypothetical protein
MPIRKIQMPIRLVRTAPQVRAGSRSVRFTEDRQASLEAGLTTATPAVKKRFGRFIESRPNLTQTISIPDLVAAFEREIGESSGTVISPMSAYRIAIQHGVRGLRRNRSRFDEFWGRLNWQLPDSELAAIWKLDRANVQSKRRALHRLQEMKLSDIEVPFQPTWSKTKDSALPEYQSAIRSERAKASFWCNRGPRPKRVA